MANPATPADIEDRWRPLSTQETTNAQTRLDDAWRMLRREMTQHGVDIEADMATDADLEAEAVRALADAVIRVLQNPEGHRSGSKSIDDASRSWTLDESRARGELYFTDAEIAALLGTDVSSTQAFSFQPT